MESTTIVAALSALAQETRLAIFRLLVEAGPDGMAAGAIAERLDLPPPTLSFHIAQLDRAGLVASRRVGRSILYAAHFPAMQALIGALTESCCAGDPGACGFPAPRPSRRHLKASGVTVTYNVLFLCTGNSARSILAEALLNGIGAGRFKAYSAGSHPKGEVHPLAVEVLQAQGLPTAGLRSKSWDEFERPGAPAMDFVFTVCDQAAAESCPVWPGQPMTAHWGLPDPAAVEGPVEVRRKAFRDTLLALQARLRLFTNLRVDKLDRMALKREVEAIGLTERERV